MKEPKRLLARGATDFERQLLASVMNEQPSALLRSRMQRALGLVGPLAWASNVKAMLGSLSGQAAAGVAVIGVVTAGAIGAVSLASTSDRAGASSEQVLDARSMEPGRTRSAPAEASPATPTAHIALPVAEEAPAAGVETLPAAGSSQLRDEIALLDAARSALQRGNRKLALASLNQYQERFAGGILERESRLLRRQAARDSAGRGHVSNKRR